MKNTKSIYLLLALTALLITALMGPQAALACPGCAQSIAEDGGFEGLVAIYSLLAGMPMVIVGSITVGIMIMKGKNEPNSNDDKE